MLSLTPQMRILLAVEAIDFRNGIDGLAGICRNQFQKDPLSGCVCIPEPERNVLEGSRL